MKKISLVFIAAAMIVSLNMSAYFAPEGYDSEVFLDEYSASFISDQLTDFMSADNSVVISGGCYNVQLLALNTAIKLNVPLNKVVSFSLNHVHLTDLEMNRTIFNYGLLFNINKYLYTGFLANPTEEKKYADISLVLGMNARNTKNVFIFTFDDFDNNYAHKEWNTRILEPRIFKKQPYSMTLMTSGEFQAMKFYSLFYRRTPSVEDHWHYEFADRQFFYDYTADSAMFFNMTRFEVKKTGSTSLTGGVYFRTLIMENGYRDYSGTDIFEDDKRFHGGISFDAERGAWTLNAEGVAGMRTVEGMHNLNYYIGFLGGTYRKDFLTIKFGEAYNYFKSDTIQNHPDEPSWVETRFIVSVVWHIADNAEFSARKGFETDMTDIKEGGMFFFYDKMYVQFHINFDPYLKNLLK